MAKQITVYTRNTCAYCPTVKEWLNNKGFTYSEVNIDTAPEREKEMTQYTMAQTVPLVIVQDSDNPQSLPKMMQGFNMARLAEVVS